jgi:hypothetical protein
VAEWIVFLHAPRDRFAETLSEEEAAIMGATEPPHRG